MLVKSLLKKKNLFDCLLLFFFLTYPFSLNLNSIAIVLLSIYTIIKYLWIREFDLIREGYFLLLYFLILVISAIFYGNVKEVEGILSLLVFPIFFAVNYKEISLKRVFIFYNISVLTSITVALFFNFRYFFSNEIPFSLMLDWRYNNDYLSQQISFNANYMSLFIAIGFFWVLQQILNKRYLNRGYILLSVFIIFYYLTFLFLLSSRLVILLTLALIVVNLLFITMKNLKKGLQISIFFIVLVILLFQIDVFKQRIDRTYDEVFSSAEDIKVGGIAVRKNIWGCSFDLIEENLLFGIGFGNVKSELAKCYEKEGFEEGLIYKYDTHNQYLQSFLSTGFLGFLVIVIIFSAPFILSAKRRNILLMNISILFIFFGTTESLLEVHKGIVLLTFFYLFIVYQCSRSYDQT